MKPHKNNTTNFIQSKISNFHKGCPNDLWGLPIFWEVTGAGDGNSENNIILNADLSFFNACYNKSVLILFLKDIKMIPQFI